MSDVFDRMVAFRSAESEAEAAIEEILGVELLGIGFDSYDGSFEIYPMMDVEIDAKKHEAIMALGCERYWVNFRDGSQIYCNNPREKVAFNRWESHNQCAELKRPYCTRCPRLLTGGPYMLMPDGFCCNTCERVELGK